MIVIFAIDALEFTKVEEFDCKRLKQDHYGRTDISEFSQPRTMVLWSSFMTGRNKEADVLEDGNREMWSKKWDISETFFSSFDSPVILDLPGFSYDLGAHEGSRKLLREFFETDDRERKDSIRKEYNNDAFSHHRKIKDLFYKALDEEHDLVLGYFSAVDVIGHLNFGSRSMMKILYREMEDIYDRIARIPDVKILVISDHGMNAVGMFGDHSGYGFWSTNFADLGTPRITDVKDVILGLKGQ